MSNVLILGSNGFIGTAVAEEALRRNLRPLGISRNGQGAAQCVGRSFASEDLASVLAAHEPAVVVNAVGRASVADSEVNEAGAFADTVVPLMSLVSAMRRTKFKGILIHISSAAIYGQPAVLPVREDAPLVPISIYGRLRCRCESMLAKYASETGRTVIAARAFSLFGQRQRRLLVWELFARALVDQTIVIRGTGEEVRDFLEVSYFAAALFAIRVPNSAGFVPVNVASGHSTSVLELAQLIVKALGVSRQITCENRVSKLDPLHWEADVGKLRDLTGGMIIPPVEAMIAKVVREWR